MIDFISGFFTWAELDDELIEVLPEKEERNIKTRYPRIYQAQQEEE